MSHPLLYFYSLAPLRAAAGPVNWAFRLSTALWFVLTAAFIAGYVSTHTPAALYAATALGLSILSPVVLHGMFFVDIDNSSLACALVLYLVVWTHAIHDHSTKHTVLLSAIIGAARNFGLDQTAFERAGFTEWRRVGDFVVFLR